MFYLGPTISIWVPTWCQTQDTTIEHRERIPSSYATARGWISNKGIELQQASISTVV